MKKLLPILIGSVIGAALCFLVSWAHHTISMGLNPFLNVIAGGVILLVAIPFIIKGIRRLNQRWDTRTAYSPVMLFVIGAMIWLIAGIIYSFFIPDNYMDLQLHDTYYVISISYFQVGLAIIFGLLAAIYHLLPYLYVRMPNRALGYLHFWLTILPLFLTFWPRYPIYIPSAPRYVNFGEAFRGVGMTINYFDLVLVGLSMFAQAVFIVNLVLIWKRPRSVAIKK